MRHGIWLLAALLIGEGGGLTAQDKGKPKKLTAKEAIRSVAGSAPRSGRKARRSVRSASSMAAATAATIAAAGGMPKRARRV